MTWALSEKIVNGIKHEARQQKIKKNLHITMEIDNNNNRVCAKCM